jgi:multisubunit Na+/H+ antiporter MnhE subunit
MPNVGLPEIIMLLLWLFVIGTIVWVGIDASQRIGARSAGWVIGCLVLWVVFFPLYLAKRNSYPRRDGIGPAPVPPGT